MMQNDLAFAPHSALLRVSQQLPQRGKAMNQVTVKRVSTAEEIISQRTIGYQIFVNGEYLITCTDINDAMDMKAKLEKQPQEWVKTN